MMQTQSLDRLIEEATVECFGPFEEMWGFQVTLENELLFPFTAKVNAKTIEVVGVDVKNVLVAVCKNGNKTYKVDMLKLHFDPKVVDGSEWIDAYRKWFKENASFFR